MMCCRASTRRCTWPRSGSRRHDAAGPGHRRSRHARRKPSHDWHVCVAETEGAPDRRFSFALAEHPLLTPLLANVAVAGVLSQYERDSGPATYALRGRAAIAGHAALEFNDVYAGDQPGFAVASAVAMPLAALLTNALEPVRVESLQLELEGAERIRGATIERVWLDTTDVRAGKTVPVKILLAPWRGEPFVRTIEVDIPRNAGGR